MYGRIADEMRRNALAATFAVVALACGGETISGTTIIESSIPYIQPNTPLSVGAVRSGNTVALHAINVLGAAGSCDVFNRVSAANVEGGFEIVVTFPADTQPGQYAMADIGAAATARANDRACEAAYNETTTDGEITLARNDTEVAGFFLLRFPMSGTTLLQNAEASLCSAPFAPPAAGTCVLLGPCTSSNSITCFELGP